MRRLMSRMAFSASLAGLALGIAGCATAPTAGEPDALAEYNETNDPLEPTNRFLYQVNDTLDKYTLKPVATAYRDNVPQSVRNPIHNVLVNISSPITFVNDVFQAKPRRAGTMLMRFLINTTAGAGGLFDVASDWGYPAHSTGFGTTMAVWGVGSGPYLFLPVIGPSNPRDATGFAANIGLDPFTYATFGGDAIFEGARFVTGAVDARERVLSVTEDVNRTALDPYATFRSLYRQNREAEIKEQSVDGKATVPAWFPR